MLISRLHVESKDNWGQQKEIMTDDWLYRAAFVCRGMEQEKIRIYLGQLDIPFPEFPSLSESA
jgi:hypothetical protein